MLSSDLLSKLGAKTRIEVFISELQPDILRQFAAHFDRYYDNASAFRSAVESFHKAQKITGRYKSCIEILCSALQSFCCGNTEHGLMTSNSGSGIGVGLVSQIGESSIGSMSSSYGCSGSSSIISTSPIIVLCCKGTTSFYRVIL